MLELFGWNVGMTLGAAFLLVLGALAIGVTLQFIGRVTFGYEWAIAAAGAVVGAWLGSEALGTLSTWGLAFDGLYLLPALIGGVVVGGLVDGLTRVSLGPYLEARPI
jgi:hypothetical protein